MSLPRSFLIWRYLPEVASFIIFHPTTQWHLLTADSGHGGWGPRPIFTGFPTQEANCKLKNSIYLFYFPKI
jgi:hypothetical protein